VSNPQEEAVPSSGTTETITALLLAAVEAWIDLARRHGIGPDLPADQRVVLVYRKTTPGHWAGKEESHFSPSFRRLMEQTADSKDAQTTDATARLHAEAAAFSRASGRFVAWLGDHLSSRAGAALLGEYFRRAGGLVRDGETAKSVCHAFARELTDTSCELVTLLLVHGFDAEIEFDLSPHVRFRRLTDIDIRTHGQPVEAHLTDAIHDTDWVCEMHRTVVKAKPDELNHGEAAAGAVLSALCLAERGRAGFRVLSEYLASPYLRVGSTVGGRRRYTSPIGEAMYLKLDAIEQLRSRYRQVQVVHHDQGLRRLRLPLRRLLLSSTREEVEDQLVDFVIGLESLLAHDTPNLESTFRFRLRGAALLPAGRFGDESARHEFMGELYGLRSSVVHGNPDHEEIGKAVPQALDALRAILCWHLDVVERGMHIDEVLRQLDLALVVGGEGWATRCSTGPASPTPLT
jgi:hypothetical protein